MKFEIDIWATIWEGFKWFLGVLFSGIAFLVGMYIKKLNDMEKQNTDLKHSFELYKVATDNKIENLQKTLDHIDKNITQWKNGMEKFLSEVEIIEARIDTIENLRK